MANYEIFVNYKSCLCFINPKSAIAKTCRRNVQKIHGLKFTVR